MKRTELEVGSIVGYSDYNPFEYAGLIPYAIQVDDLTPIDGYGYENPKGTCFRGTLLDYNLNPQPGQKSKPWTLRKVWCLWKDLPPSSLEALEQHLWMLNHAAEWEKQVMLEKKRMKAVADALNQLAKDTTIKGLYVVGIHKQAQPPKGPGKAGVVGQYSLIVREDFVLKFCKDILNEVEQAALSVPEAE